jgi:acetoacetyl-CoA reductase
MAKFTDKIAVITGGVQDTTMAMVKKFTAEGAKVAVLVRAEADAETVKAAGAAAYLCNIGSFDEVTATFDKIKAEMGPVDILVQNPNASCRKTLLDTTPEEWAAVLAENTHSLFYCAKQVFADMKERQTGKVINFGSYTAMGVKENFAHAVTKAATMGFHGSCARETEKYTVTANCINPAYNATAEEVADLVMLVASEEGRVLHGQILTATHSLVEA